ncbi:MAG TPA: GlsB/YeaQ/YmgE family stress response membrane protein [Patescibacteria group bacterium]|nr:GlsB/YeaQ/YmgE family stress response membrane protein [Patescibacteria group bacterium]
MGILAWIILGGIAGWIASMIAGTNAQMGLFANVVIGIIGAFLGGLLFSMFGGAGVTGLNAWSLIVSIVGASVLLLIIKTVRHA